MIAVQKTFFVNSGNYTNSFSSFFSKFNSISVLYKENFLTIFEDLCLVRPEILITEYVDKNVQV